MADQPAPQSPLWWLNKLEAQLSGRAVELATLDSYYAGNHPLPFLTPAHEAKMRSQFRQLLNESRSNFMRLVVDAVEERLKVEGFRVSASSNEQADQETWTRIWQPNQMDQESQTAILEALIKGVSYLSVWPDENGKPQIAVEDATQTIIGYVPGSNYRQRAAAVKVWLDDWTGMKRANVYLPDGIYKFQRRTDPNEPPPSSANEINSLMRSPWQELADQQVKNPYGVVPIIPLRNRPRLLCEGESEIADVFRIQQKINGFLFLLALAGYFGAHRQRWMSGVKIMTDDATGQEIEPFDAAIDKLWQSENPDARFGEFGQTDLSQYVKAIEQAVLHIAVITRTPRHYLVQEGQSPSGDAIKSAESGLVKKAERKQRPFGEGFEEAIRLARRIAGMPDTPPDSEIVWADPQVRTEAETVDAVIKLFAAGLIPWAAALEKSGFSPQQIERFQTLRMQDNLIAAAFQPAVQPPQEPEQAVTPPVVA